MRRNEEPSYVPTKVGWRKMGLFSGAEPLLAPRPAFPLTLPLFPPNQPWVDLFQIIDREMEEDPPSLPQREVDAHLLLFGEGGYFLAGLTRPGYCNCRRKKRGLEVGRRVGDIPPRGEGGG